MLVLHFRGVRAHIQHEVEPSEALKIDCREAALLVAMAEMAVPDDHVEADCVHDRAVCRVHESLSRRCPGR